MSCKKVNIVNFLRGCEPRLPMDLEAPVTWQKEITAQYGLPVTWLLQYDAMIQDFYVESMKSLPANHEVGIWFEIPQQLCEACGIPWRGRYSWDWHTHVAFSVGYTVEERQKLADELVRLFREKFGYTPKVMGAWLFDAALIDYLHREYGIEGACNCRDQWGTDGYTLWGGYWANAYYPCRLNAYLPAQTTEEQIDVPVFRMLGSDPIYQYGASPDTDNGQPVVTLEPVYYQYDGKPCGGGTPEWVDWFFRNEFAEPVLGMAYAQAGQENSFGLPRIVKGLSYQYELIAKLRDEGKISVETMGESARWFRKTFPMTPATSICALEDWRQEGRQSIWYMNKGWRINLFRTSDGEITIRDWQLFSEEYAEPFWERLCTTPDVIIDALPVCDSICLAGDMRFIADGKVVCGTFSQPLENREEEELCCTTEEGAITLRLTPGSLQIVHNYAALEMETHWKPAHDGFEIEVHPDLLIFTHNGMKYGLQCNAGEAVWIAVGNGARLKIYGTAATLKPVVLHDTCDR